MSSRTVLLESSQPPSCCMSIIWLWAAILLTVLTCAIGTQGAILNKSYEQDFDLRTNEIYSGTGTATATVSSTSSTIGTTGAIDGNLPSHFVGNSPVYDENWHLKASATKSSVNVVDQTSKGINSSRTDHDALKTFVNGVSTTRKGKGKGNRYLWPVGIAIAVTAAATFGLFAKIIWSVSMLTSVISAASIFVSLLSTLGNSPEAYRRHQHVQQPVQQHVQQQHGGATDQYYADKRLMQLGTLDAQDFTTEYSTIPRQTNADFLLELQ